MNAHVSQGDRSMFAVFAGESYYADAGWRNYRGSAESPDAACRMAAEMTERESYGWWQVVDLEARKIIAWHGRVYGYGPGPEGAAVDG